MGNLSWGKPRIFVKDLDTQNADWVELNTPVEDSTELQPTKGDKMEAPIEGGENEEEKNKDTKYAVVYNIRKYKGRTLAIGTKNGVASKHYAFLLQPEDPTNLGFYAEKTSVSVDDTFTPADGAIWAVEHSALAAASGNTIKWGTVSVSGSGATKDISFVETQPAEGVAAVSFTEQVTTLSSAGGGSYTAVVDPAANPKTAGYYERTGSADSYTYRLTWDEEVVAGKTYYTLS